MSTNGTRNCFSLRGPEWRPVSLPDDRGSAGSGRSGRAGGGPDGCGPEGRRRRRGIRSDPILLLSKRPRSRRYNWVGSFSSERERTAMPIHNWTRVDAGLFHAFHHNWITSLSAALNDGVLPPDYYALPEQ